MFKLKASLDDRFRAALLGLQVAECYFSDSAPISQSILTYGHALLADPTRTLLPTDALTPEQSSNATDHSPRADEDCQRLIRWFPFLLRWHDQPGLRHHSIATAPLTEIDQTRLWCLGHLLEFLLSASVHPQQLRQHLYQYLIKQLYGDFPPAEQATMQMVIDAIWDKPTPPSAEGSDPGNKLDEYRSFIKAIHQFVTLPESHVLAMNNAGQTWAMRTPAMQTSVMQAQEVAPAMITGVMAGAWDGPGVIPVQWIGRLPDHGTPMAHLSKALYADWAGVAQPLQRSAFSSDTLSSNAFSPDHQAILGLPL